MTDLNAADSVGGLEDDPGEQNCKIKVCLWTRPMSKLEESRRSRHCIHVNDAFPRQQVMVDSPIDGEIFDFTFDRVFEEQSGNVGVELNHLYQESVLPILQSFAQGYNGCVGIYGQTGTGKATVLGERLTEEGCTGILPRLIHDLFDTLLHSTNQWEYILRCSYVELYMEKLFDLLIPNNSSIFIPSSSNRISIRNVSEVCCIHPSDIFQLLVRGNANRKCITSTPAGALEQDNNNWRSHTFLILTLEQRNTIANHTRLSTLTVVDFAGSECSTTPTIKKYGQDGLMEAKLIHRGLYSLHGYVRSCCSSSVTTSKIPIQQEHYQYSKLTQILRHAIGGNCKTSFIITASPSSCSIQETLNTFRFAQQLQTVENANVRINQYQSILDTEQLRDELNNTLRLIQQCRHEESKEESSLLLQENLHYILKKYCGDTMNDKSIFDYNDISPTGKLENEDFHRIISALQNKLSQTEDQRGLAEGKLGELQSEVSMLRSFNRLAKKEQEKLQNELIEYKKEGQILSQKTHELERKLRTSAFRESQATVFLRQFRRFYRRLLKHKATMGTGNVKEIIQRLPGVPDLNDLIDVDTLLYEAGLIEDTEKTDDHSVATFRPSENSLSRSFRAARKLAKTSPLSLSESKINSPRAAGKDFYINEDEEYDDVASAETKSTSTSATQSVTRQPSAVQRSWSSEREDELQALKEECVSLQAALNDEKIKLSAILDGADQPVGLKKLQVECMALKKGLGKKCHDLEAVIWKMNELHLINKTYSEKMSNREKHVLYLEETVQELQRQNRILLLDKHSGEDVFRAESKIWHDLIDSLRLPLWQFEEQPVKHSPVTSRIMIPVIRYERYEESLPPSSTHDTQCESLTMQDPYKTVTSTAVQSEDIWPIRLADKDYVEVSTQTEKLPDEKKSLHDASAQTADVSEKKSVAVQTDVQTDSLVAHSVGVQTDSVYQCSQKASLQVPMPNPSNESASFQGEHLRPPLESTYNVVTLHNNPKMREMSHKISNLRCFAPLPATIVLDANDDVSHITSDHFFPGGKGSNYVPKRFAQKIRPNKPNKK